MSLHSSLLVQQGWLVSVLVIKSSGYPAASQQPRWLLPQVSQELIRMAILWHEMWHEALEEASRLYFGESNVAGMLAVLTPLHDMMEKMGPTTLKEIAFVQVNDKRR